MKKWFCSVAGLFLAVAGPLAAQAQTPAVLPPNILNIETINIKPYMDGFVLRCATKGRSQSSQRSLLMIFETDDFRGEPWIGEISCERMAQSVLVGLSPGR